MSTQITHTEETSAMDVITQNLTYIIAAVVVIAVLIAIMVVVRSFGGKIRARRGSRLGISEYYEIDNDRQLLLIRRDDREHLVLIGGNQDLVIESGIEVETETEHQERLRRAPRREVTPREDDDNRPIPLRPSPRPAVFGDRSPAIRPVGRDEPKLGAVQASEEEK
jgi:Meckel syndrome type 1 protein